MQEEMQRASVAGDVSTLIKLIARTSSVTPADFIKETVGDLLFMYYIYLERYHTVPMDLDDLVDGLLAIDAKNYILRQSANE